MSIFVSFISIWMTLLDYCDAECTLNEQYQVVSDGWQDDLIDGYHIHYYPIAEANSLTPQPVWLDLLNTYCDKLFWYEDSSHSFDQWALYDESCTEPYSGTKLQIGTDSTNLNYLGLDTSNITEEVFSIRCEGTQGPAFSTMHKF